MRAVDTNGWCLRILSDDPSFAGGVTALIAIHIRIPNAVYEDQGPPIRLTAGDCFIQPPEIRHRVLEASEGIEIGVPAEHITEIDHDMTLPTSHLRPDRDPQRIARRCLWAMRSADPSDDLELLEVSLPVRFTSVQTS